MIALAIFVEMIVSAIFSPLRWIARRYPKHLIVVLLLATAVLIAQVEVTGKTDPKIFTAVLSVVLLSATCMAAAMWPTPIEDDRPPRVQPPVIEDWYRSANN